MAGGGEACGPVDGDQRLAWLTCAAADGPPETHGAAPWPGFGLWRLQRRATDASGRERAALLAACIEAFDAIVADPVDSGNDEGPFHAVARWMSLEQVGRALAVVERMAPFPWTYRLGGSRAALVERPAVLGDLDAAWEQLACFDRGDPFAPHWLADTRGSWAGAAVELAVPERLDRVDFVAMEEERRWVFVNRAAQVGPSAVWFEAVEDELDPVVALPEFVDEAGVLALRQAEALLRRRPEAGAEPELLDHPMADPWGLEACLDVWLATGPGRYELDPDALRLERRGAP